MSPLSSFFLIFARLQSISLLRSSSIGSRSVMSWALRTLPVDRLYDPHTEQVKHKLIDIEAKFVT